MTIFLMFLYFVAGLPGFQDFLVLVRFYDLLTFRLSDLESFRHSDFNTRVPADPRRQHRVWHSDEQGTQLLRPTNRK